MAYDINSYIGSIQNKRKSSYSPFGGSTGGNLFGRIGTGISSFINRGAASPQSSAYKPQTMVQPQSTSAVGSNSGVSITPPKTTAPLPPAGQTYVSNLSSPAPKPVQTPTATAPSTTSTLPTQTEDAYISYLKTLFNPESSKLALSEKESAMKRLADLQSQTEAKDLAARREYEAKLDEAGGLREGARESASASARRSNQELADLAVQESAAARSAQVASDTYNEYINAGKTVFEAETAAKDAAEKAKQQVFENDLAMKKFEEDKRQFGMEYALAKQKADTVGTTTTKNLNPTQLAAQNNANSALLSISNLTRDITDANGNIVPRKLFTLGLGKVGQAKREITDVISRIRTGAALTKEEEAFYKKQIPRAIDNDETILQKLNQLTAFYAGISGSPITLELPDGSIVVADDMFDSLTRTDVRQALSQGANIISY